MRHIVNTTRVHRAHMALIKQLTVNSSTMQRLYIMTRLMLAGTTVVETLSCYLGVPACFDIVCDIKLLMLTCEAATLVDWQLASRESAFSSAACMTLEDVLAAAVAAVVDVVAWLKFDGG